MSSLETKVRRFRSGLVLETATTAATLPAGAVSGDRGHVFDAADLKRKRRRDERAIGVVAGERRVTPSTCSRSDLMQGYLKTGEKIPRFIWDFTRRRQVLSLSLKRQGRARSICAERTNERATAGCSDASPESAPRVIQVITFMPARAKARRADCAPGPGVLVLFPPVARILMCRAVMPSSCAERIRIHTTEVKQQNDGSEGPAIRTMRRI